MGDDYLPTYLNGKEWREYKEGGGKKILRNVQDSLNNASLGYEPGTTWDDFKNAEGVIDSAQELAAFGLETGIVSLPDMVAAVTNAPVYITSRSEEIAQERAANDGRAGEVRPDDMAVGATTATIITAMEKFGAERVFGAFVPGKGGAAQKILKAAVAEGSEAFKAWRAVLPQAEVSLLLALPWPKVWRLSAPR
jgi:hypothetical protein